MFSGLLQLVNRLVHRQIFTSSRSKRLFAYDQSFPLYHKTVCVGGIFWECSATKSRRRQERTHLFMWWCKFLNDCTCRQFVYLTVPRNWLAYPCNHIPVPIMICAMPYKYCAIIRDTRYEIAKLHAYSRTPEWRVVSESSPFRIISSISPRRDSNIFLRSSKE